MIKKNFQLAEPVIQMLGELAGAYGKKSDGLIVTAGLLLLRDLDGDAFTKAVAEAHRVRHGQVMPAHHASGSAEKSGGRKRLKGGEQGDPVLPARPQRGRPAKA